MNALSLRLIEELNAKPSPLTSGLETDFILRELKFLRLMMMMSEYLYITQFLSKIVYF